jgi:hypothetical protein
MEKVLNTFRRTSGPALTSAAHTLLLINLEAARVRQQILSASQSEVRESHAKPCAPHSRQRAVIIFAVELGVLFAATTAVAQSTFGSIRGVVQDSTGAAISNAHVTLHSIETNSDRVVESDAAGAYALENVLAGTYSLRASYAGFADSVVNGIVLKARQDSRYTLTMSVASESQTVEVTSSASQLIRKMG